MEYAFTDSQVRRDRDILEQQVHNYIRNYAGAFQPVVDAKRLLADGYGLNVAQMRMVLNAMRADTGIRLNFQPSGGAQVIEFPRSPRGHASASSPFAVPFDDDGEDYKETKASRRVADDPRWFEVDFKFNMPYGMTMQVRGEVIHLMSQERSKLTYYPIGSWHWGKKVFGQPKFHFKLYYECSEASKKLRMLTESEAQTLADHGLMRFCRTCQTIRGHR
jgi:hypothetical protein